MTPAPIHEPGRTMGRAARRARIGLPLLIAAWLASALLALGLGSADIGLGEAWRAVAESAGEALGMAGGAASGITSGAADDTLADETTGPAPAEYERATREGAAARARIIMQVRLPRVLLALLVGGLLALCGVVMQAFFRNVMAEPYLVGVSSGAALGAVLAMLLGWSFRLGWFSSVPLSAFLFALGTVMLVYLINRRRGGLHTAGLLLSGIAIASAVSAIVALLLVTSERSVQQVLFWLLGSLAAARWTHVWIVLPYAALGIGVIIWFARDLDLLLWGDTTGAALGAHVSRTRTWLLAAASLMTAAVVSVSGVIGFVGLMVPHICRSLSGSSHRRLLPVAFFAGGILLVWADVAARTLRAPTELPLGAITAIVGAPFLIYLCGTHGRSRWRP